MKEDSADFDPSPTVASCEAACRRYEIFCAPQGCDIAKFAPLSYFFLSKRDSGIVLTGFEGIVSTCLYLERPDSLFGRAPTRAGRAAEFERCVVGWFYSTGSLSVARIESSRAQPEAINYVETPGVAPPDLAKAITFVLIPLLVGLQ